MNISQHTNEILEAALEYARHGWYVLPCEETMVGVPKSGKLPIGSLATHGCHSASRDEATITEWWSQRPNANIAISCGPSNLLVIDLDDRDGKYGSDEWRAVITGQSVPNTIEVITGSGGRHIYFSGAINCKKQAAPGLEFKSIGGYVIAPPSLHTSGRRYEWDGCDFYPAEISNAPRWVVELASASKGRIAPQSDLPQWPQERLKEIRSALAYINPDEYDVWLMVGQALHSDEHAQGLGVWHEWSQRSAKYDPKELDYKWNKFRPEKGLTLGTLFKQAKMNGWEEPEREPVNVRVIDHAQQQDQSDHIYRPPAGVLRDVYDYAMSSAPVPQSAFALSCGLALGSFMLGRSYRGEPRTELNLYVLNIGDSGSGKEHPRTIIKEIARACNLSQLVGENVFSGQAIIKAMARTNKRIYLFDEFGLVMQRGASNGNTNQKTLMQILLGIYTSSHTTFCGFDYASDDRDTVVLERPCLTLFASTTPDTFYPALKSCDVASGFMPRFVVFKSNKRTVPCDKVLPDVPIQIIEWVDAIRELPGAEGNLHGVSAPIVVRRDSAASALLEEFKTKAFEMSNPARGVGHQVWTRAHMLVSKISTISACMIYPNGLPFLATEDHMAWAIRLVETQMSWIEKDLSRHVADTEYQSKRNDILAMFSASGSRGLTTRDIQRGVGGLTKYNKSERDSIIKDLRESGDIVMVSLPAPSRGRSRQAYVDRQFVAPEDVAELEAE